MTVNVLGVVRVQVDELAGVLGRLRRRLADDDYALHLIDRAGTCVEVLHALHEPTAADLYADFVLYCGDEEIAVDEAIAIVDDRVGRLRRLLGVKLS